MSLTAIVFWLIYVGGLAGALLYPVVGAALYVLVYHVRPETQWWGDSFERLGLRTSFTVALATVIGLVLRRPRLTNGARQLPPPLMLLLALAAYALFTLAWADPAWPRSIPMGEKVIKLAIFVLILVRCVRTPGEFRLVTLAWLLGVAYIGYEAWGGAGGRIAKRLTYGLGGPDFAESSDLAIHLVASLPLVGAWFFGAQRWRGRAFALAVGALAVNTIVMTRTRNALFGIAAMSLLAVFWLPRGYRTKGLVAITAGIFLAVQLADPGWWARMRTIADYRADVSAANRLRYWDAALRMALDHPQGIGLGQFHDRVREYLPGDTSRHSPHSTPFGCLAELGLPGITLLAAIVLVTLGRLGGCRRWADQNPLAARGPPGFDLRWQAMGLQAALVGYLACALFAARLWAEDFWILLGLAACLQNVRCHVAARTTEPAAPGRADWPTPATPPESAPCAPCA